MNDPVTVTQRAAEKLREFAAARAIEPARGVRLDIVGGAGSGFAYDIFFDTRNDADRVIELEGIRILLRPDSLPYIAGATMDWVESNNGAGFQIRNPNEPEK